VPDGPCARDGTPGTVGVMTSTVSTRTPLRIVTAVVLGLLALALLAGTVMFTLVLPEVKLVGWAVVVVVTVAAALWSVPGVARGSRTSWTVALCWVVSYLYWGLYKVFVEGETESLVFTAVQVALIVLLLLPAVRPRS
jgi:hypothetical protein